jgi:DNA-binding transcriptional ArsR family regulator
VSELAAELVGRVEPPRDTVRIGLVHVHLPVLEEAGLVEFDHRSRTVRYRRSQLAEELLAELGPE